MGKASRDKRDIYYRLAKEQGWRARSAFKLIQIDAEFDILKDVRNVVDLCAAPGGWTQVLKQKLSERAVTDASIVAVDLQQMSAIEGVHVIQGDITSSTTAAQIVGHFDGGRADLVVCDGAPDVIGLFELDEYVQAQLVLAALWINTRILRSGGCFVAKVFRARHLQLLIQQLRALFEHVIIAKPRCSRNTSRESFVVCRGFRPVDRQWSAEQLQQHLWTQVDEYFEDPTRSHQPIEFVACGPLNGIDADRNYSLDVDEQGRYECRAPIQMPIRPPYEQANLLRKNNGLQRKVDHAK